MISCSVAEMRLVFASAEGEEGERERRRREEGGERGREEGGEGEDNLADCLRLDRIIRWSFKPCSCRSDEQETGEKEIAAKRRHGHANCSYTRRCACIFSVE